MRDQIPGCLTASRVTTPSSGMVAEVVINDKTDAYGRWFADGSWSAWQFIADGVRDASVAALEDDEEPAVLVSLVVPTPRPVGGVPYLHVPYQRAFYRLSASGVVAVGLWPPAPRNAELHAAGTAGTLSPAYGINCATGANSMDSHRPGRIISADLAAVLNGDLAEVVIDSSHDVYARYYNGSLREWSAWRPVASRAHAAAIAPYGSSDVPAALISVASWRPQPESESASGRTGAPLSASARDHYLVSAAGVIATTL